MLDRAVHAARLTARGWFDFHLACFRGKVDGHPGGNVGGEMISNLQLLRGLAALAVVFYHTAYTFNGGVHTEFQAVAVFFVISGFIMTHITRAEADQFLSQRLIRIVPLYWLCTLAALAAVELKSSGRTWDDASLAHIAESLLFVPYRNSTGEFQPLLAVGWTLNLEMFFYLLFAGALIVSRRFAPLLVCAVLVAFKLTHPVLGCEAVACTFYAHGYTTFLILGMASYYVWRFLEGSAAVARPIVLPGAAIAIVVFITFNAHPPFAAALQGWSPFPLWTAMPALLVTSVLLLHSAGFRCSWRFPLLLGDASYSLYLTHTITISLMFTVTRRLLPVPLPGPSPRLQDVIIILVVCLLVAIAVYAWVEAPMLKALRTFLISRDRGAAAATVSEPIVIKTGDQAGSARTRSA
jgi:exopolysaccharide production protein ExoZ